MSLFGWSLPAGCRTLPGEEPEEPMFLKCGKCGRFLPMKYEGWEHMEFTTRCSGRLIYDDPPGVSCACGRTTPHDPHEFVVDAETYTVRTCKSCGHRNLD